MMSLIAFCIDVFRVTGCGLKKLIEKTGRNGEGENIQAYFVIITSK